MKQLWVLTGGNGAGKSKFYELRLKPKGLAFVNADILAKEMGEPLTAEKSKRASRMALAQCQQRISAGENFCYETVFSHSSKVKLVEEAIAAGYEVVLVYIHLRHDSLNQLRVQQRVSAGGHDVPAEKIKTRIPRTIANVKQALSLVHGALLYDNSKIENEAFAEIAQVHENTIISHAEPLPEWAEDMLEGLAR